jgi:hypothetical protein
MGAGARRSGRRAGRRLDDSLLALHDALERFVVHDPAKVKLVGLKFFAGLTLEQAAGGLGISLSTAGRSWRYARAGCRLLWPALIPKKPTPPPCSPPPP